MENMSKTVIIAGTIIIILFVATFLTIFFYKAADETKTISGENISIEVLAFNSQFTMFDGINRKKSDIDKLISKVNANNKNSVHKVKVMSSTGLISVVSGLITFNGGSTEDGKVALYEVLFNYNSEGRIISINIDIM